MTYALGANSEGNERVKSKAITSGYKAVEQGLRSYVSIRRNVQHLLGLNLIDSTRFVLITVVVFGVSASGPTGCLVSYPHLSYQNL